MKKYIPLIFILVISYLPSFSQITPFIGKDGVLINIHKYDSTAVANAIASKLPISDTTGKTWDWTTAITGKPTSFTPSAHTHIFSDLPTILGDRVLGKIGAGGVIQELSVSQVLDMITNSTGSMVARSSGGWVALNSGTVDYILTSTGTTLPIWSINPALAKTDTTRFKDSLAAHIIFLNGKQGNLTVTTTGSSGPSTLIGNTLNIPQYSGSPMVYPSPGIPISTGSGWEVVSITDNSANWNTAYTNRITTLTTTGLGGASTLIGNVLNIPTYQTASASLTNIAGLANASGYLKNNGGGPVSYSMPTWTEVTGKPSVMLTTDSAAMLLNYRHWLAGYITLATADANYKPIAYVPSWTEITSKPATFTPSAHTHALAELLQSTATSGQVATWNGTSWVAQTPATGSGTVSTGNQYRLAYYTATGTTVGPTALITGNRALVSDANGLPTHTNVTTTELNYVSGVTSPIQTQLNSFGGFGMNKILRDSLGWIKLNGDFLLKAFGFDNSTEMSFSKPIGSNDDSDLVYQGTLNVNSIANNKLVTVAANSLSGNNTGSAATRTDLTVAQVKTMLSLSNVDNTSDATKNSAVATLTNKRITKRVVTVNSGTPVTDYTPSTDDFDEVYVAAQGALLINNPIGTPTDGQELKIVSYEYPLSFGTAYTVGAPNRYGNIATYVLRYNSTDAKWQQINNDSVGTGGGGITSLNGLTGGTQTFATGTTGTDFNISSATTTHTFNIPTSSPSNRGLLIANDYKKLFTYQSSANPTGTITHDGNAGSRHEITFTGTGARTLAFSNIAAGYITKFFFDNTSGAVITLTLPASSFVMNTIGVYTSATTVNIPVGKTALILDLYNGTNYQFTTSF